MGAKREGCNPTPCWPACLKVGGDGVPQAAGRERGGQSLTRVPAPPVRAGPGSATLPLLLPHLCRNAKPKLPDRRHPKGTEGDAAGVVTES